MAAVRGPRSVNSWWAKRATTVNIAIVVAVLLFVVWKSLFP
jgi:hypothetical protein